MRILVDMQAIQGESKYRGIGRYSGSLAHAMIKLGMQRGHDMHVLLSASFPDTVAQIRASFEGILPQQNIHVMCVPVRTAEMYPANHWRTRAAECERERVIAGLKADFVHCSSLFEGWLDDTITSIKATDAKTPTAVTLYDLIPYVLSDIYLQDAGYRRYYLQRLEHLKRADLLLAISDHSRKEAIELLGIGADKVVNVSGAIDASFKPRKLSAEKSAALLGKYQITRSFILYVPGGFDPRKNFDRLIQAYAALPRSLRRVNQLVIASKFHEGMAEEIQAKCKANGLGLKDVVLTGYVQDDDLISLYSLCKLYVFPSLHEGLGLPALEAMACGAPVIGSNTTSLPEVIGRPDALFDPYSVASMSALIKRCLTESAFEKSLRAHAIRQARKFSWERSATVALDAYESHFSRRKHQPTAVALTGSQVTRIVQRIVSRAQQADAALRATSADLTELRACVVANGNGAPSRQLLVDISELVNRDAKSGIQRVVRSILLELLKRPPAGMLVRAVYSKDGNGLFYARRFTQQFLGKLPDGEQDAPVHFGPGDVFVGLDLTAHLFPAFNQTLRQMRGAGVKIHYVVYDLTPLVNNRWHTAGMTQAFTHWIDGLGQYAHSLVCISRAVARDVRVWFKEHPPQLGGNLRISAFHLGADIKSSQPSTGLPKSAGKVLGEIRKRPSFLMVGTIEPRKGYNQSIEAFDLLWKCGTDVNLVIVGKAGWNTDALIERIRKHPQLNKRLFWLEGISDEYLQKVYRGSSALLAASEAEGFGLPLIEAAQQGLPIIARNLPVFKEVACKHATYFSGFKPLDISRGINRWIALDQRQQVPGTTDMPWLTWRASTQQLLVAAGLSKKAV